MPMVNMLSGQFQDAMYRSNTIAGNLSVMNQPGNQDVGSENPPNANAPESGYETSVSRVDQQQGTVLRLQSEDDNPAITPQILMNQYDAEIGNQIDIFA